MTTNTESTQYTAETAAAWLEELFQQDAEAVRQSAERQIHEYERIAKTAGEMSDENKAALADVLNRLDDPIPARTRTLERSYRFASADRFVPEFVLEAAAEKGPVRSAVRDLGWVGPGMPASELRMLARERLEAHLRRLGYPPIDPDKLEQWVDEVLTVRAAELSRSAEGMSSDAQAALAACGRNLRN